MQREAMHYDAVIVGAGPAGLAAAITLRRRGAEQGRDVSVCVLEKGAEVGAHILSGAVVDPRALDELLPDWRRRDAPLRVPVAGDHFWYLTATRRLCVPGGLLPAAMRNHGCYIASLGNLCRWLAGEAEALGVEIYPGFAAAEVLFDADGAVAGVATGPAGLDREGRHKPGFEPGVELRAPYTLFAEGCRGSLAQQLLRQFRLDARSQPQTYGLGVKELWEVAPDRHRPGHVLHTTGWPLDGAVWGGGWVYHLADNLVSTGLVVGLDYADPRLDPYAEMQRWKTHPALRELFAGGRRVGYGARALDEGGLQSLPEPVFPGGLLIGAAAGCVNVLRLKGSHIAMKTGMLAAEAVLDALAEEAAATDRILHGYVRRLRASWARRELYRARNVRPAFARWGRLGGMLYTAADQWLLRGRAPWTLPHGRPDHVRLARAADCPPPDYPRPDGVLTFDKASSVYLSNTMHEADQPPHLRLRDASVPVAVNLARFDAPEQYYCPAGVYEIVREDGEPRLQINAQNCVHCKTCDIKDPTQNIVWTVPEGGGGPNYSNM